MFEDSDVFLQHIDTGNIYRPYLLVLHHCCRLAIESENTLGFKWIIGIKFNGE